MTTRKFGRTALIAVLALSIIMGITGGTIAWFTDEVTSANNIIKSGILDVDVYCGNPAAKESILDKQTLFNGVSLWEPGAVAWENLTVANLGTLAFNYEIAVNVANENKMTDETQAHLSQILKVGYVDGLIDADATREEVIASVEEWKTFASLKEKGMLLPVEHAHILDYPQGAVVESKSYGMVIYWEPTAEDNNWNVHNGKTTDDGMPYLHIDLGVKVTATQLTAESDSFDNTYDGKSFKDTMDEIAGSTDHVEEKVELGRDETIKDDTITVKEDDEIIIDLKGHKLTIDNVTAKDCIVVETGATLTITDTVGGGELQLLTKGDGNNEIYVENTKEGKTATLNITGDAKITLPGDADESIMIAAWAEKGNVVVNMKDNACVEVNGALDDTGILIDNGIMTMEGNSKIDVLGKYYSCGILLVNGSTLYIKENADIYAEGEYYETGIVLGKNATVDMSGGSITANYTGDSQTGCINGAYLDDATSVFNMTGGKITVNGKHCASGIISDMAEATINVNGGTFYVNGELDTDAGYNIGIEAGNKTHVNLTKADFYVNVSNDPSSKIQGMAVCVGRRASIIVGKDVKVYATNSSTNPKKNFGFCDYNSKLDFSLEKLSVIAEYSSNKGVYNDRLNAVVPFTVNGEQLTDANYTTLFDKTIVWQTAD